MYNLVHVGIHKSGSTFLQKEIFPKIKNYTYLGFLSENKYSDEIRYLQSCSDLDFDENKIRNLINFFQNFVKEKKLLVSSEAFTGNISPQFFGTGIFIDLISKRIKKYIPNPKIVLILRNQRDAIYSLYKDDIQFGYTCTFDDWIKERLKTHSLEYFKYDKIVTYYQKFFGEENVKIFFYENIFKKQNGMMHFLNQLDIDIDLTQDDISNLINSSKANFGNSNIVTSISRLLNHVIKTKLSQSYTDGKYDLYVYNFWRYFLSKKISRLLGNNEIPNNANLNTLLIKLNENNKNLFKILNLNLNEKYNFK